MPNTDGTSWDEGHPLITDPRRDGAQEILSLRQGVKVRGDKEHVAYAASSAGGEHKAGSAVSYIQATAPTLRPDGSTSLGATDAGRLWVDTDTLQLFVWDDQVTPGSYAWFAVQSPPDATQIFQFRVADGGASPTLPLTATGLTAGTYIVWVEGTTIDGSGSGGFTVSLTVNSVTETIVIDNVPDGTAPFCIAFHVTVAGTTCSLTAASNVQRIMKMHGFLTVAS